MNITTTVIGKAPTLTYLRKFVEYIEDLEPFEPLDLNSSGVIPKFLKGLLVGKKKLYLDYPPERIGRKDDFIRYIVNEEMIDRNRHYLTRRHINQLNSFLYSQFHAMLFWDIRKEMKLGKKEKEVIWDYMELIGIEEDEYSLASIKRAITRLRRSKNMPHLRHRKN